MTTLARSATGTWRKSSRSNNGNNGCVELAWFDVGRGVRDSKQAGTGPVLKFEDAAVACFLGWVTSQQA
jgi:hypothetical protein